MEEPQECGLGSYQEKTGHQLIACTLCRYNTYNDKIYTATSEAACKTCEPGSSTVSQGAMSPQECIEKQFTCEENKYVGGKDSNDCFDCPAGYFGDNVGVSCVLCPRGYYQEKQRQGNCKQCVTDDHLCQNNLGATSSDAMASSSKSMASAAFSLIAPSINASHTGR